MEVTDAETYALRVPIEGPFGDARASVDERFWIVVELETDAGHVGTGWLATWRVPELFERYLADLAATVVGRDPHETAAVREALREQTLYYPGEVGFSAHPRSAIDVALWDLKAQDAGVPLFRLLGGADREVPVYVSGMDAGRDEATLAAFHGEFADEGFTRFKTKVGNRSLDEDAARVAAVREAVGPDAELFVDANQTYTPATALRAAERFDASDVGWFEEPVAPWNRQGYERVSRGTDVPVASGEMVYRLERLAALVEAGTVDVVQPDLIRGGGVSGLVDAAHLAARHDLPLAPHIHHAVSGHVVSAARTGWLVEYIPEYDAGAVLDGAPPVDGGTLTLPDRPGHGYRVSDEARATYTL
ncbi:MAG: mandelate racemase/muconate lactonizing enzyme family protein [Halobacteriaceae archaeon]